MTAVLLLLALLGAWEAYARLGDIDVFLLPAPTQVAEALWEDRSLLASDLAVTAVEVGLGLLLAIALGVGCAVVVHLVPALGRAVQPLLVASQTIPIVIIAPLLVAWFGFDLAPKVVIVALVSFFPIAVTTLDGLRSVDPALRRLLRTLDARRCQVLLRVEAPQALPAALSGTRIAVAVAVIGAVLAEQAGSEEGLGHLILQAIPALDTPRAYAAVVVLSAFAIALYALLALAERALVPWARASTAPPSHREDPTP